MSEAVRSAFKIGDELWIPCGDGDRRLSVTDIRQSGAISGWGASLPPRQTEPAKFIYCFDGLDRPVSEQEILAANPKTEN